MRARVLVVSGAAALATAVGCASILSIPDRSPAWCDRPENAHDFCDDFDHTDAGGSWGPGATPGASVNFVSSSDTPPNALDLSTTPKSLGGLAVGGLYRQFADHPFDHVRLSVDVRFISIDLQTEGGLASQLGFLLLEQQGFCIGVVLTPAGIGMVMRAHATDCTGVSNMPADAGRITDEAGLTAYAPVGPVPGLNQWFHVTLDVKRHAADGSGTVGFNMNYPGVIAPPQIPSGFLTTSAPAVAVATSVVGPSGQVELQFDDITVDFPAN